MFEMRALRVHPAVLFAAAILIFAACSAAASPSPSPAPPTATPLRSPVGSPGGSATYTVNVANKAGIGAYLTGVDNMTLYEKKGDSTTSSNCTGTCLTNWPPFTIETGEQVVGGTGATGTFASFDRPEGMTQVTYNGKPLYYFANDTTAGDTNGQGVAGVWSVAVP